MACPGRLAPAHERNGPLDHAQISHLWHEAEAAVLALDGPPLDPDVTVNALAGRRAAAEGTPLDASALAAWIDTRGADYAARGFVTRRQVAAAAGAAGAALIDAWDEGAALRVERDQLEAKVIELGGARVLADELAAELERDEWIRARLRKAKATAPARALIKLRKALVGRARGRAH